MRLTWIVLLFLAVTACETRNIGSSCVEDFDCDRSHTTPTAHCVLATNALAHCPGESNSGGTGSGAAPSDCICCPIVLDPTMLSSYPSCLVGIAPTDSGPQDTAPPTDTGPADAVADVSADTGPMCLATCAPFSYCDYADGGVAMCMPQRPNGFVCTTDMQCQSTYCTNGFCCNSRCQSPGLSCAVTPDFAGECMTVPDAGVDAGVDASVDAGPG